ncbi:MAG: amidohydrolase [Pseudomonadales bacterium]|nr:amidohydrolase [Pseudomonadales bacterium]
MSIEEIPAGAISADSHITEPPNCYIDYIDPKFRADAPHIEQSASGDDVYVIKGVKKSVPLALLDGAGYSIAERKSRVGTIKFEETRRAGWDPEYRKEAQEIDGIAAEIIYASVGMALCTHPDIEYKNACMQAYNRWLADFCGALPNRLFGLAQTAVVSVDSAIEDFRRAKEMGMVGMMMPGEPVEGDYDYPEYDALWECATDLDMPIAFHILTSRTGGFSKKQNAHRGHPMNGFLTIIRAVQDVVGLLTLGGVFERHPKLKMVCAEGDAGWMPHYMYRMDHAAKFNVEGGIIKGLSKLPSEYLKNNVWMTFQDDWTAFKTADLMNYKQLIWANDFPHTDSTWPDSQALLDEHAVHLTTDQQQAIMRDNVAETFNLPAGNKSWKMQKNAA